MKLIYNKQILEIKCVMCKKDAGFIAPETNEPLCLDCTRTNEEIKEKNYPNKPKCRTIQESDLPQIIKELKRQGIIK